KNYKKMAELLQNGTAAGSKDVTLDMMDYKYIDNCNDVKELERIFRALKSGKDGYFPHLISHCENKVREINPRSKELRKLNPITRTKDLPEEEAKLITNGISDWRSEISSCETTTNPADEELPPIRQATTFKGNKSTSDPPKKNNRIRSYDYKSWDKFDADNECAKVDKKIEGTPSIPIASVSTFKMPDKINGSWLSDSEKLIRAGIEKDKGNEAFKAADYDEALIYYSRSISLSRTAASINNRALSYIRLQRWKEAESDCNDVLQLEPENLKAKLRRATARKELLKYVEAKTDLQFVLEMEPHNSRALKILEEVEQKLGKKSSGDAVEASKKSGRKMIITEVSSDEENTEGPVTNHCDSGNKTVKKEEEIPEEKSSEIFTTERVDDQNSKMEDSVKETISHTENLEIEDAIVNTPPAEMPEAVLRIKNLAKESFLSGQYSEAANQYSKAIKMIIKIAEENTNADHSHNVAMLYNNKAACCLKMGDDRECIANCNEVLVLKGMDTKALIRRACAFEHLEKYKQAYLDFRSAQSIDWRIKHAQDGANRVAKHLRDIHGPNWKTMLTENKVLTETSQSNVSSPAKFETKPSSEADIEKKKEEIRRSLFEKLKTEGNSEVKRGNYEKAVVCYTKCMDMCPNEVASYTNRALCYLKLNKSVSASSDCTEALKRDPKNIKALFRRAQANKNLKNYEKACQDLNQVLKLEPENKSANTELVAVKKLKRNFNDEDFLVKPASSVKSDVSTAKVETRKRKIIIEDVESDEETTGFISDSQISSVTDDSRSSQTSGVSSKCLDTVPTPYEFGNAWNAVHPKNAVSEYKRILDRAPVDIIPALVTNKTTDHMIVTFSKIARYHLIAGEKEEVDRAYGILLALSKAQRFNMAAMFLSEKDKKCVLSAMDDLESAEDIGSYVKSDIENLRVTYML
uniref:RNA-polymerase II-associated protein 3-like C-terminal domain-containing protein n=1 Tax=Ciona savignyi TaxID=51511 RepID=H2ZC97_CIOSA